MNPSTVSFAIAGICLCMTAFTATLPTEAEIALRAEQAQRDSVRRAEAERIQMLKQDACGYAADQESYSSYGPLDIYTMHDGRAQKGDSVVVFREFYQQHEGGHQWVVAYAGIPGDTTCQRSDVWSRGGFGDSEPHTYDKQLLSLYRQTIHGTEGDQPPDNLP